MPSDENDAEPAPHTDAGTPERPSWGAVARGFGRLLLAGRWATAASAFGQLAGAFTRKHYYGVKLKYYDVKMKYYDFRMWWLKKTAAASWWWRAGVAFVLALMVVAAFLIAVHRALTFGDDTWVIEPGDTLHQVAEELIERGVIQNPLPLKIIAKVGDRGRRIRAGEYRFPEGTSLNEFLNRIVEGKGQVGIKVTILEGWTFRQMRAHLNKARKLKPTTRGMTGAQIMQKLGHPDLHPEGRFFPDTYAYAAGESDMTIYKKAFALMESKLERAWENRGDGVLLNNKDEALIMASIIEKESWLADEQRQIAGVFYNRIKKGMRLQTDPTVIYGLGASFDGNLTRAHLRRDNPYNTYTRGGLTPTPISLPGDDALFAATQPVATRAYYFVASGGGKHQFSETLAQHNRAVAEHIRGLRKKKK